jgi:hypothetical protein
MKVTRAVQRRTLVRLPADVTRPFEVFVNGVPQREGLDYEVLGGTLLFDRELRTYRQNDSVDVVYTVGGRKVVATRLPLELAP